MADRFSAFSFIDRITRFDPGVAAQGRFTVPVALGDFSPCLVAEAVGQLAAWVAMEHTGFARRPVAALAEETRIVGRAGPGDEIELNVDIEGIDADAVTYRGWACVHGATVIELERCAGPLLPMEEFEDPEAARQQFETLTGLGMPACRFPGVPDPAVHLAGRESGTLRAALRVPTTAAFFADHFPRRPVFPATLLLDAQIRLAMRLALEPLHRNAPEALRPARVEDVKLRAFIAPGATVDIAATLLSQSNGGAKIGLLATLDAKRVATARVTIVPFDSPSLVEHTEAGG